MIFLKHVEYEIKDDARLKNLLAHLAGTTSQVSGVTFRDIWFSRDGKEFVLLLECEGEEKYHAWREICPPPPGARDRHEVFMTRQERFPDASG